MPSRNNVRAKSAVIREWDAWAAKHDDDAVDSGAGMLFFNYLQINKPDHLDFPSAGEGDKWHIVHDWLLKEHRVKD